MKNRNLEQQTLELSQFKHALSGQDVETWVKVQKVDYLGRQQRYLKAIILTNNLLSKPTSHNESLLDLVVQYHSLTKKKTEEYILILSHFKPKDYEAQFILQILCDQPLDRKKAMLYLKTRSSILKTYKAQKNKQYIFNVSYNFQEWFNIILPIFSTVKPAKLVSLFSEAVKELYKNQSKNEDTDMTGADILKINIKHLISYYEEPAIRKTEKSTTPRKNVSRTPKKEPQSVSPTFRAAKQVIQARQTELINKITDQVDDLRSALGREKSRIHQLVEREKYFISMINKLKGEFCDLAESFQSNTRLSMDIGLLQPIMQRFKQFQRNIFRRESAQMRDLQLRQEELLLIRQIEKEERETHNYGGNRHK